MRLSFTLIPVLCLWLSGCGFSPVRGLRDGEPVTAALRGVTIANIPDREGQQLRNHLIDRMHARGRAEQPEARLEVSLRFTETDLAIRKDATASRRQLNMWATYALRDNDGKQLLKGSAHSVVSYSKLDAQYGTAAAERDAKARALKEVGEQIVNRLSLYYTEKQESAVSGALTRNP